MQIILFKSQTPGFNALFESIPKITGEEKTEVLCAGEHKLFKEIEEAEVVCEAQGQYFVQTLPARLAEQG